MVLLTLLLYSWHKNAYNFPCYKFVVSWAVNRMGEFTNIVFKFEKENMLS